ncbi:hypothetical protein [Actinoplanes sp. DH11]|uniref:hypothetical protein n=1 Tax=Actinoplanes sp. DH11 TaxID=2857011 RepID=UPI001E38304C|nr:hypothetical protein [Actinoplanes sp. DH11]
MPDNSVDPSGNTEAFRAFTRTTSDSEAPSKLPFVIGGVVAVVVLLALVAWLTL